MSERPPVTQAAGEPAPMLPYGISEPRGQNVIGIVGLVFALLGAVLVAILYQQLLENVKVNIRVTWILSPKHFAFPVLAVVLGAIGLWRGRRALPTIALAIGLLTIAAALLLGGRTWGRAMENGASAWHWPEFE